MKKTRFLPFLLLAYWACCPRLSAQNLAPTYAPIGTDAFQTGVWSPGYLFLPPWYVGDTVPGEGFAFPAGSTQATAMMGGLWVGGLDPGGQLRLSAQDYHMVQGSGQDFWPGPLTSGTALTDSATMAAYNQHWRITAAERDAFLADFADNGVVDSPQLYPGVFGWPAFGQDAAGNSLALAPFVDLDGDPSSYDPLAGDYPDLLGTEMLWGVTNDVGAGGARHSTTAPLGLEVHQSVFVFACDSSPLSQALFVRYEIINRSNQAYDDLYLGMWTDPDIGGAFDDYAGVDTSLALMYAYNGGSPDPVYGAQIPAWGVGLLQGPLAPAGDGLDNDRDGQVDEAGETWSLTSFASHRNDFSPLLGNPSAAGGYYAYLRGEDLSGTPFVDNYSNGGPGTGLAADGAGIPLPYLFPGDACAGTGWTASLAGVSSADWRMVGGTGPISLAPGQRETLSFQFSVAQATNGDPAEAVCALQALALDLRQLHALEYVGCQFDGLVFPGDANHDQLANAWDLLPIGLKYGTTGPNRPGASLAWSGQAAPLWGDTLASGLDLRHVDTDGNGLIDQADTLAISLHYGRTHASLKGQASGGVPLLIEMNFGAANPGDTLHLPILLGNADTLGEQVYGLAFQVLYDTALVDPGSIGLDMGQSWLGEKNLDLLSLFHDDTEAGIIEIGMVRTDQTSRTHHGQIGSLIVVLDDDIAKRFQPFTLSIGAATLIDPQETPIPLSPRSSSVGVSTGLDQRWPGSLHVFPLPAQGYLDLRSAQSPLYGAQLWTLTGQEAARQSWPAGTFEARWSLPALPGGWYLLRVETPAGRFSRPVLLQR